ncbi:GNAT family N-acetyltransferase [Pseudoalteromonas luteoviolacea]|uniref:GNAT family N-acetyltransferase n=1 Tax=Pseudoalteromonas luteoviolacea TaxID=43657 RepID=UPI001B3A795E|nr:GNAT family protein [Pseudoalteromonas luteoviolacea]MBQ4880248.1 GNAT family N-acetyltransferase [Pseudoalteromonas luteoviolacea]MBQ4909309.1 GNAT family N-acetyltransferase [Pseudoalteromonas luteoviolacea]
MWLSSGALEGDLVVLEPLSLSHCEELRNAVSDGTSWQLWYASVPAPQDMQDYVEKAIKGLERGEMAFVVKTKLDGKVVGTTRFYDVKEQHRRASIGYTWYSDSVRRTGVNTECKYLLISYLFETKGALSLEFKTHFFNQASRTAIERLGAKLDGILRSHQVMPDGSLRDTAIYSILSHEWPAVKNNLRAKLNKY